MGYVYNDLKLENIMITSKNEIRLIDFGFAKKYVDSNGAHMKKKNSNVFHGNMMFATLSQFEFETTSRKDDLISLCYLMIYLLNDGKVPYSIENFTVEKSISALFKKVKKVKQKIDLRNYVQNLPGILKFVNTVFSLGHYQQPNYYLLR